METVYNKSEREKETKKVAEIMIWLLVCCFGLAAILQFCSKELQKHIVAEEKKKKCKT